jgi:hypothetical protein
MRMNFPSKGSTVYVEGYGSALFAGASLPENEDQENVVFLKFEFMGLDKGYGNGIISVPVEEFKENRVYPEQVADGEPIVKSTEKRDQVLDKRREELNE